MTPKRCYLRLRVKPVGAVDERDSRDPFPIYPLLNRLLPTYADIELEFVSETGEAFVCNDVRGIAIDWKDADLEPLEVTVRLMPSEVDIETRVRIEAMPDADPPTRPRLEDLDDEELDP